MGTSNSHDFLDAAEDTSIATSHAHHAATHVAPSAGMTSSVLDAPPESWLSYLDARFALSEQCGAGAEAWVYRGIERATGRSVAVKILRHSVAEGRDSFVTEGLVLSQLEHPGIVRYLAHGEIPEGTAYVVTEWLPGLDLATRLAEGVLSESQALSLIARVASAVSAAHARGIIHQDLKPSNIYLIKGDPGTIRLLDFGIARLFRSASSDPEAGSIVGTPAYMGPEQVLGESVSSATDVFALGCVLFTCLTGRPIFEGDAFEIMERTAGEDAPRLSTLVPSIRPALDDLLASMLALDPAERPSDATALLARLAELPGDLLADMAPSARALLVPEGVTGDERVPVAVVVVRTEPMPDSHTDRSRTPTLGSSEGAFHVLADGTYLALAHGNASAADQAAHAARLALRVRSRYPNATIAIAADWFGSRTMAKQLHDLTQRAKALLSDARGKVVLDDAAAKLLASRFAVESRQNEASVLLGDARQIFSGGPARRLNACIGRDTQIALLEELAHEARTLGRASVGLLSGPAGIGKSRVLSEAIARVSAVTSGASVWSTYGDSMSSGSPFGAIASLISGGARTAAESLPPQEIPSEAASDGRSDPPNGVGTALARLIGGQRSDRELDSATGAGSANELHLAFSAVLSRALERGPLILVLEDLHWMDPASVRAIDHALRTLRALPLLVLATARPEVHDLFPDLFKGHHVRELKLGELSPDDADQLVAISLGEATGDETRKRIVERAQGNAFVLNELIQAEAEGRSGDIGDTVLGIVQSRLRRLDPEARRVLRAASILGASFSQSAVHAVVGQDFDTSDLGRWLELLVARDVLVRRDEGEEAGASFVFAHALVRDATYDMLTDTDRCLGHRLAGEWLESTGGAHPIVMAQHFERGENPAAAGRCYALATIDAFELGDLSATVRCSELARKLELLPVERGQVLALAGEALRLQGDLVGGSTLAAQALPLLPGESLMRARAARTAVAAGFSGIRFG